MAAVRIAALLGMLVLASAAKHAPPPPPPPAAPAVAPPTIKDGVEKWRAGDYAAAVAIWQPFATAGDADALFNLGQAYKLGRGVTADAATARDYYRKAAVKGHLPAQANLGIALFQAGEKPEAIKWLKTAADRGEARAQYVLGIAAFNGDGMARSQSLGYAYLLRAQASGLPQAATALSGIVPGLAPADRSAGEAIAASLATGGGVPPAIAATAFRGTAPSAAARTALPVVTPPPVTTAAATVPPVGAPSATSRAAPPATLVTPVPTAGTTRSPSPLATAAALPPPPRSAPPVPIREPSVVQADAATKTAARDEAAGVAVATVAIPASRPAADPLAPKPARVTPPEVAHAEWPPSAAVPLKPFQTAVEPAHKPDGWRVQLGAFSSRKLADAAWAGVRDAAAPAKPLFATDGTVTKLQMGPFATHDAAKAACAKLTAAGRACFVTQG